MTPEEVAVKRLDHVGIVVNDLKAAAAFFSERLNLKLERSGEVPEVGLEFAFFACGDARIEIIEVSDPVRRAARLAGAQARIDHLAVEVEDVDREVVKLRKRGVATTQPTAREQGPTRSYWTLPDSSAGIVLQLLEYIE